MNAYSLSSLEEKTGYQFHDEGLLLQALTHSSFTNELKINRQEHYERLEFLGDAVLELVTSDFLFKEHPELAEGDLTKMRASIVCEPTLALCARQIDLGNYIRLGKGEENNGGRKRDSIISDVMEALIGAIFLDGGMDCAETFILRFILSDLEHKRLYYDSKSNLQELIQGSTKEELSYHLADVSGPEHDQTFIVDVYLGDKKLGSGEGHTKKRAEQEAAYAALLKLHGEDGGKYVSEEH